MLKHVETVHLRCQYITALCILLRSWFHDVGQARVANKGPLYRFTGRTQRFQHPAMKFDNHYTVLVTRQFLELEGITNAAGQEAEKNKHQ